MFPFLPVIINTPPNSYYAAKVVLSAFYPFKNLSISDETFIKALSHRGVMDAREEITLLLYMDKTPQEIITLGYPKELVLDIFEREFVSRLEGAGLDYWEQN